jgi:diacylglycerol kinase family enzyme
MSVRPVVQLFYNPTAGSFSSRKLDELTWAFRAEDADIILTPSVDAPPSIHPAATHVCIAGGDGTIRHVAMMLVRSRSRLPVTIYPTGTVNLLARENVADPSAVFAARSLIQGEASRLYNPVTLGDTMFFVCASVGPDSIAVARLSPQLKSRIGRAAYLAALAHLLIRWPRPKLLLRADGVVRHCEAVHVAKGRYYAGPWSFAPNARGGDGTLHVLALRRARRRDYLRFIGSLLLRRDPAEHPNAIAFTCTTLSISSDCDSPVQADGDLAGMCPVDLSIHREPISFCDLSADRSL